MGSSEKRRKRREALQRPAPVEVESKNAETAPTVLRLVRSEEPDISHKPVAAGFSGSALSGIPEFIGSDGDDQEEARRDHVVAETDTRTANIPRIVKRTFDAAEINVFFNDPAVFSFLALPGVEQIDLGPALIDSNVALLGEDCSALFVYLGPEVYEVHAAFTMGDLIEADSFRSMQRWMFTHTDCATIIAKVPSGYYDFANILEISGAPKDFERPDATFWTIRYEDWVRSARFLIASGEAFGRKLIEDCDKFGAFPTAWTGEEAQSQRLGALSEMLAAGQFDKAVFLYNRFAVFGGYAPIEIVSHQPKLLRFGSALIQIMDESFKVVQCR